MLLNNVELQGLRGRGGPPGGGTGAARAWPPAGTAGVASGPPAPGAPAGHRRTGPVGLGSTRRAWRQSQRPRRPAAPGPRPDDPRLGDGGAGGPAPSRRRHRHRATAPGVCATPAAGAGRAGHADGAGASARAARCRRRPRWTRGRRSSMIDLAPIRREMFRQIVPEGRPEELTPEERQRIAEEVNQRMLGIVAGHPARRRGTAEARGRSGAGRGRGAEPKPLRRTAAGQSRAARADWPAPQRRRGHDVGASPSAGATNRRAATPRRPPRRRRATRRRPPSAIVADRQPARRKRRARRRGRAAGQRRDQPAERARHRLLDDAPRPRRSAVRGRADGQLYTRNEADRARVEALGAVAKLDGPATARLADWIVVTTADPSGSGLKLGIARPVGDSLATLRRTAARNAGLGALFIGIALIGIVPLSTRLTRNLTDAERGRQPHRAGRLPRARAGEEQGRGRPARRRVQPDGGRRREASAHRRWSRSASSASSSSAGRSSTRCCRTRRCASA